MTEIAKSTCMLALSGNNHVIDGSMNISVKKHLYFIHVSPFYYRLNLKCVCDSQSLKLLYCILFPVFSVSFSLDIWLSDL